MTDAGAAPPQAHRIALATAEVQLMLGQLALDRGEPGQALEWFRSAARGGDARAFNMLGRCHERGWGAAADTAAAARHYARAIALGDVWAMFNLADLHGRGEGVARDDAAAYALYVEAAGRGHLKSLNMLGLFHETGRACSIDREGARAFFLAAAEGGDCWGCFNAGRLLLDDGDTARAADWFERGLQHGFADFYRMLGEALAVRPEERLAAIGRRALAIAG